MLQAFQGNMRELAQTQFAEDRRPRHQDDAADHRGDACRLKREQPGADMNDIAEDQHPEHYAGSWLRCRHGGERCMQRCGAEGVLHQPESDDAGRDRGITRPCS